MAEDADYLRLPIPPHRVVDVTDHERPLTELARNTAVLLLYGASDDPDWAFVAARVPALLADVPRLTVRCVLRHRAEVPALPAEARVGVLFDATGGQPLVNSQASGPFAVLLGVDGLLAGGPVFGAQAIIDLAREIRWTLLTALPDEEPDRMVPLSTSIDVIIPFRHVADERLRNLRFTVGYYRRHLPMARIVVVEQDGPTSLAGVEVDQHLTVAADPDLFHKSLLLNAAAAQSSAAYLVFADADCIPEVRILASFEAIVTAIPDGYVLPHDLVRYLDAESTASFVAGGRDNRDDVGDLTDRLKTATTGGLSLGSAAWFHRIGGYHQQGYLGWGGEDDDLYFRSLFSDEPTARISSLLLHLDHPSGVMHPFTAEQVAEKLEHVPAPVLPHPRTRQRDLRDFFRDHKVALATNSHDRALFTATRRFSEDVFPSVHVVDGSDGTYGDAAFRKLITDPALAEVDYLLYTDEDNVIVDWPEVRDTFQTFREGAYGFAGMPDGGVISHRFHNPLAINPFMAFIDLRAAREVLAGDPADLGHGQDLLRHWPAALIRPWDGRVTHPRIQAVLDDGFVPYGVALDNYEPYYSLWFQLLRAGLVPLYLGARDAPEMDDDGCCTALLGSSGTPMAFHTWFARSYRRDELHTVRINKVLHRARSRLRW